MLTSTGTYPCHVVEHGGRSSGAGWASRRALSVRARHQQAYTTRRQRTVPDGARDAIGERLGERGCEPGRHRTQAALRLVRRGRSAASGQDRRYHRHRADRRRPRWLDEVTLHRLPPGHETTITSLGTAAQAELEPVYETAEGWRKDARRAFVADLLATA